MGLIHDPVARPDFLEVVTVFFNQTVVKSDFRFVSDVVGDNGRLPSFSPPCLVNFSQTRANRGLFC